MTFHAKNWFVFFFLVLLSPVPLSAQEIVAGYLKEIGSATSPSYNDAGFYEYISGASLTVINLKQYQAGDIPVNVGQFSFDTLPVPREWHFYEGGGGYIDRANTKALHELKISLPDCSFGNVCSLNGPFSALIPEIEPSESHKAEFFVNGKDVSSLFYYDSTRGVFAVKEFYEAQFFKEFQGQDAVFSWTHSDSSGELTIISGNRTIKGRIRDLSGQSNNIFAFKKVRLVHAGTDRTIPHEIEAEINAAGEYSVSGLPSFDYNISVDILPSVPVKLEKLSGQAGRIILELSHALPRYDISFTTSGSDIYAPGELVILKPSDWDERLTGTIKTFQQLSGDKVPIAVYKDKVVLITPVERVSSDDLVFYCETDTTKLFFKMLHPVPVDKGYEQFSMFDNDGIYARTEISNLLQGGVFPYEGQIMPTGSVNTISRIMVNNTKVHYYNGVTGRAVDITDMFIWNDFRQGMYGDENRHNDLYTLLSHDTGTLAMTFCEHQNPERCFRIKHGIRPGGAEVSVNFQKPDEVSLSGAYIVLEELHKKAKSIYRMDEITSESSYRFSSLPTGVYLVKILDTGLSFVGSAVVEVTEAQNAAREIQNISLNVQKAVNVKEDKMQAIANGNLYELAPGGRKDKLSGSIVMHHNDYKLIDLVALGIEQDIDAVNVLGQMSGDYTLYPNKKLALFSQKILKDSDVTLLIESGGALYRLPVFYQSSEYVIVKEKGLDYGMCPEERPLCSNAFVSVGGVSQGIYNGSKLLSVTFPFNFSNHNASVFIDNTDITNLFSFDKRTMTLKKEYLAAFLSTVVSDSGPVRVIFSDRVYELAITPGYKSLDVSVVDQSRAQSPLYTGIQTMLSCEYLPDRYYSQFASVDTIGVASFANLPECSYNLRVVDREQMFQGEADGITIGAGQNKLRTVFAIGCTGSSNVFINNCEPFLPVVQDRKMVTPDFGVLFTDRLLEGGAVQAEVDNSSDVQYRVINPGVVIFMPVSQQSSYQFTLINKNGKTRQISVKAEPLSNQMIKMLVKPLASSIQPLSAEGLTSSHVFTGNFPLVFKMGSSYKYTADEVSVLIDGRSQTDISELFVWDPAKNVLTLKESAYDRFISLLKNKQQHLILSFGQSADTKHYMFSVVIGAGAGDISGLATGNTERLKEPKAILLGRCALNGAEYRQLTDVKSDYSFVFTNVPSGIYDLVLFDQTTGLYGKREIFVDRYLSDIYIELPVQELK